MEDSFAKVMSLAAFIVLGHLLRRFNILKDQAFAAISALVMNVTLPCVILTNLNGVRIEGNTVTQNGEPLFAIHRRHSAKKTQGCYRELTPTLEYIRREKKQEKPSIRDQLKAAAKSQPEKKAPAKAKSHDMEL